MMNNNSVSKSKSLSSSRPTSQSPMRLSGPSKIAPEILHRLRELASHSSLIADDVPCGHESRYVEPREDENVEFLGLLLYCVSHGMSFGGVERDAGGWCCPLCVDLNKQRVYSELSR